MSTLGGLFFALLAAAGCGGAGNNPVPMPDLSAPDLSSGTTNPPVGALPFFDGFEGSSLSTSYAVLHENATGGLAVTGGRLQTTVTAQSVWWMNQNNALFIHRSIDAANFAVTTTVQARNAAALSQPIGDGYHYAGPMIRLPTSDTPGGAQNFAFIGVGYQSGCNGATTQCIEAKSTQNSAATILRSPHGGGADAQLRICKVGSQIMALERDASGVGPWVQRAAWSRPDLSGALQVGVMAFSFELATQQLRAQFEDLDIRAVNSVSDCSL